jgi:hypothetical protein
MEELKNEIAIEHQLNASERGSSVEIGGHTFNIDLIKPVAHAQIISDLLTKFRLHLSAICSGITTADKIEFDIQVTEFANLACENKEFRNKILNILYDLTKNHAVFSLNDEDFLALLHEAISLNKDFLTKKIAQLQNQTLERLQRLMKIKI